MPEEIFDKSADELTIEEIAFEAANQMRRIADAIEGQNAIYIEEMAERKAAIEAAKKENEPDPDDSEEDGDGEVGEVEPEEVEEDEEAK